MSDEDLGICNGCGCDDGELVETWDGLDLCETCLEDHALPPIEPDSVEPNNDDVEELRRALPELLQVCDGVPMTATEAERRVEAARNFLRGKEE